MLDKNVLISLPKAELHAHLNGSISTETVLKLLTFKDNNEETQAVISQYTLKDLKDSNKSLEKCFEVFRMFHQLVNTHQALYTATVDVIHEFVADNVQYLELRTTPRQLEGSLRNYADVVIKAIDDCHKKGLPILVKLLISVDRSKGLAAAEQNVYLAIALKNERPDIVAGLDVSGYMLNSDIEEYFPLLSKAREKGLKITVHTAEVPNDAETLSILKFKPDRIGHATYAINTEDQSVFSLLKNSEIPVELCLTSNVRCQTVKSYSDHHIKKLRQHEIPFSICTDDKGVFLSNLSDEYWIVYQNLGLSLPELWSISRKALDYAFVSREERTKLAEIWDSWKKLYSL